GRKVCTSQEEHYAGSTHSTAVTRQETVGRRPVQPQGWFASLRSNAYRKGLPGGFWLPPWGSTVTKTASSSASCLGSSRRSTQRRFDSLSMYRIPRLVARADSPDSVYGIP